MTCFQRNNFDSYKLMTLSITWPKIVALSKFRIKFLEKTNTPSYTILTELSVLWKFFTITFFTKCFNWTNILRLRLLFTAQHVFFFLRNVNCKVPILTSIINILNYWVRFLNEKKLVVQTQTFIKAVCTISESLK